MEAITYLAAGFASGVFVQRFFIWVATHKICPSLCDYCRWFNGKNCHKK